MLARIPTKQKAIRQICLNDFFQFWGENHVVLLTRQRQRRRSRWCPQSCMADTQWVAWQCMADAWLMPSGPGRTSQPLWFPPELLWSLQPTESNIFGQFLSSWWSFSSLQCHNHHNCKKISRPLVDRLKGWIVFSSLATSSVSVKCCSQAKLYKSSDHIKSSFWIGTSWVMPLPHFLPFPLQQSEWQTHFLNSAIFKSNCTKKNWKKVSSGNSSEMDSGLAIHVKWQEAAVTFHLLLPPLRDLPDRLPPYLASQS